MCARYAPLVQAMGGQAPEKRWISRNFPSIRAGNPNVFYTSRNHMVWFKCSGTRGILPPPAAETEPAPLVRMGNKVHIASKTTCISSYYDDEPEHAARRSPVLIRQKGFVKADSQRPGDGSLWRRILPEGIHLTRTLCTAKKQWLNSTNAYDNTLCDGEPNTPAPPDLVLTLVLAMRKFVW